METARGNIEKGKQYLVTGASGFLGQALCKEIINQGGKVVALARNEGNLIKLRQQFDSADIYTIPGDIENKCIVEQAMQGVSGVFHLAAFKHVTMAEEHALQCTTTNIQGSINVLEAVKDSNDCKFIITTSTDKAAQIKGVYGASKYIVEKLFQQYQAFDAHTKYRVVRYGNVLGSTGSVLEIWKQRLLLGWDITVNNPNSTRFYFTRESAVDLIFQGLQSNDVAPLIPQMKGAILMRLAEAMARSYYTGKITSDIYIVNNLGDSENLHETMDGKTFSNEVEQYTVEELMELI